MGQRRNTGQGIDTMPVDGRKGYVRTGRTAQTVVRRLSIPGVSSMAGSSRARWSGMALMAVIIMIAPALWNIGANVFFLRSWLGDYVGYSEEIPLVQLTTGWYKKEERGPKS